MGIDPLRLLAKGIRRTLGPTFLRNYVRPLRLRGRKAPYDAKRYYDSRYAVALARGEFSDATTMKPGHSPLRTRYHYNAVENTMLEHFLSQGILAGLTVLDVGSGAGHWIDFYRGVLQAETVVGVEISAPAVRALREKYEELPGVTIVEADVSSSDFALDRRFAVVSAVGVLYHIVDDGLWRQAVRNLANHLAPGGSIVVGDYVGLASADVGFHRTDEFSSWEELREANAEVMLVGKRIRSLRDWKACARQAGLEIHQVHKVRKSRALSTPANRVLILVPRASPPGGS